MTLNSTIIETTISEVIDSDYKSYAHYTVSNRAIPSVIDGLKPVSRKVLYSMVNVHKGKKTKVADIGSISNCVSGDSSIIVNGVKTTVESYYESWAPGDNILAFDESTNIALESEVFCVIRSHAKKDLLEIELDGGETIKVTHNHLIMTDKGWKRAEELTEDDCILKL